MANATSDANHRRTTRPVSLVVCLMGSVPLLLGACERQPYLDLTPPQSAMHDIDPQYRMDTTPDYPVGIPPKGCNYGQIGTNRITRTGPGEFENTGYYGCRG